MPKLLPEIRPVTARDHDQIILLWQACGLTRPWNHPERDLARKQTVQPELFLGAFDQIQAVGSVMAGYDGHRGWMNYLAVHPEVQRQGLGRRLVQAAELGLQQLGCPKVNLQLRTSNLPAQAFYRRLGYTEDAALSFGKRLEFDSEESQRSGGAGTGGGSIRNHWVPGDLGALIQLSGLIYAQEFRFQIPLEARIAEGMSQFMLRNDPRERIWIVEKEGQVRGSLAVEWEAEHQAKLRWLILHPDERGKGLGRRLVENALSFIRSSGGTRVSLVTARSLHAAIGLYESLGFRQLETLPGHTGVPEDPELLFVLEWFS